MTTRLFETPLEFTETPPLEASIASRIISAGLASLVVIIPALTASFTAFRVTTLYAGMRNAETAGSAYITSNLHVLNTPMVIALGISALLAIVIALIVAVEPKYRLAAVGMPFSIGVPLIASVSGLLLWIVETTTLDILSGKLVSDSVQDVAAKISLLLMAAMAAGVVATGLTFVCSIVSLFIPVNKRTDPLSLRRPFVWAVSGVLFLVFAGAFFVVV